MKIILLLLLLLATTNIFAQQQQDSVLTMEIAYVKSELIRHQETLDSLVSKLDDKIEEQSGLIDDLGNQNDALKSNLDSLNQRVLFNRQSIEIKSKELERQSKKIQRLLTRNKSLLASIDSLRERIEINSQNIVASTKELGGEILETRQKSDSQISILDDNVEKNRLYWIIATLATILLGGLVYWLLGKRITASKTDVETQIKLTKASLEEEGVRLDNKLISVLETQLKLQKETLKSESIISNEKADHSLALKVADEIIRIQKNLSQMDESTKGLKQLNSSVQRIQDNFASNGYELVDMLGKEYNEGMKATVNFVQDEDFEVGKRIITRIIKPQVNFKGTMIQTAQIEVTEA